MNGTLNVDTGSLNGVGNSISDVAAQVRDIYTKLQNTINAVTANDSWKGAASSAFLEKFEAIRPEFERDLASLEDLGPTIREVASGYEAAEDDNVAMM
ncbi:MAG: WXG100 family type VII secretion target [Bacilli bacterium]|nr:WXG100 family type VII secretion target [Bacilli bacterium]